MPEILTVSGIFLCYARRQRSASEQRAKEAHGGDEPAEHSKVPFIAIRARGRCTHDCLRGCISRFFRCSRVLIDILVIALFCQCTRVLLSFRTRFGISLSLAPVNLIHIATILRLRIKRRSIRMSAMTIINSKLPSPCKGEGKGEVISDAKMRRGIEAKLL